MDVNRTHQGKAGSVFDRLEKWFVAGILALFLILAATYSIITPIFEGFDENWHFAFVQYVATGKGLPRQPADQFPHLAKQEASQPPLYYAIAAVLTFWIPNNDGKIFDQYNPQFQPIPWDYRDNKNIIVHTSSEDFPWQGTALAVHLARFLSVALGAATVYCTYLTARLLFPFRPALAVGAMLVNALTPSFIFTSALVNNDSLVVFLASAAIFIITSEAMHLMNSPSDDLSLLWPRRAVAITLLSVILGLASLTKLSGLALYVLAVIVFSVIAWRTKLYRTVFVRLALLALGFLVISSWWYVRNWNLYSDPTGLNMMLDVMGRREPGFGIADLFPELEGIRRSYWALFGQTNIVVSDWIYYAFDFLSLVACVGWLRLIYRAWHARRWKEPLLLAPAVVWVAIIAISLTRWTLLTAGSQGRLLYPAIGSISILLMRGWSELVPRRISVVAAASLVGFAIYVPFFVITPAYAQPEQIPRDQIDRFVSRPLSQSVRFGEVELLGYQVAQEAKAGEVFWVDACWFGADKIAENDTVFVQLLEENDLIAGQKDTLHGLGTYPTSQWKPGTVFCDRYPLRVRDTAPPAIRTEISIGMTHADGERLPASVGGKEIGDNFRISGPSIKSSTIDYTWGGKLALDDYKLDRTALLPGESFSLRLTWRMLTQTNHQDVATVQVMDSMGKIVGQNDNPVKEGLDVRSIPISPYAEPGVYEIKLGVYQPAPIENLPLYHDGRRAQGSDLVSLWWMRVVP